MDYVFACVNVRLADYIQGLMGKYDAGQGNYKNILYPLCYLMANILLYENLV